MADSSGFSGYVKLARKATDLSTAAANASVKYAKIDAATSGDNTVVAAVADKKIRVLSLFYLASANVNVRWESGAGGTALTGALEHTGQTGVVLPFNEDGWFETAAGELLNLELSGNISVDGSLSYIEV
jgi:hypothetical protein